MSWLMEGSAMRKAVVKAFQEAGCTVSTLQDSRLPLDIDIEATQISDPLEIQPSLWSAMRATDHGILIAPETGGALADLTQWTQHVPGWSLGCTLDAIRLCTDKLECSKFLKANLIPHPQTWTADHPDHPWTKSTNFIVIKPRDGAGSLDTFKTPNSFNIRQKIKDQFFSNNNQEPENNFKTRCYFKMLFDKTDHLYQNIEHIY